MASNFVKLPPSGGAGANTTLSNLTSPTAINQSLFPDSPGLDLGSASDNWGNVYAGALRSNSSLSIEGAGQVDIYSDGSRVSITSNEEVLELYSYNTVVAPQLRFGDATANPARYVALKAADSLAGATTYTLPTADGTSGQVLSTNGSGALSWVSAGSGANTTLSNLSAPVALNQNLNFATPFSGAIGDNAPASNIYSAVLSAVDSSLLDQVYIQAYDTNSGNFTDSSSVTGELRSIWGGDFGIGTESNGANSGSILHQTGHIFDANNSGSLFYRTGNSASGNSGNISLLVGTAGGTQGNIRLHKLGTTVTVGHVWTATSTDGQGYWAAAPSGGSSAGSSGAIQFSDGAGGFLADSSNLFWDNSNDRLGISTSSPSYKLHVLDTAGFLGYFKTSAGGCLIGLENDTGIQVVLNSQSGTSKVGTNTNHDFYFATNNTNRVQITAGGNFVFTSSTGNVDASAATGPLRLPNLASDPGSPLNGDMWYNTTSNQLKARVNGVTVVIA